MSTQGRFPFRFFVITFALSWLIWLPLVLGYHGVGAHREGHGSIPWRNAWVPLSAKELLATAAMDEEGFRPGLVAVVQTFGD